MADSADAFEGWVACQTETGAYYYFNTFSQETAWELPPRIGAILRGEAAAPSPPCNEAAASDSWLELEDNSGAPYYFNSSSGEATYSMPAALRAPPPGRAEAPPAEERMPGNEPDTGPRDDRVASERFARSPSSPPNEGLAPTVEAVVASAHQSRAGLLPVAPPIGAAAGGTDAIAKRPPVSLKEAGRSNTLKRFQEEAKFADPDCGTEFYKHLSIQECENTLNDSHPRVSVGDKKVQHACCEELGRHHCCGTGKKSGFDEYGIGIVLYFKFLKFGACVMFTMCLLGTPALFIFYTGQSAVQTSVVSSLAATTLGNLGTGLETCFKGIVGDPATVIKNGQVSLSCPAGMQIGDLIAFFGTPGECSCPAARVPKPNCVGVPNGPTCVDKAFCYKAANRVMQLGTLGTYISGPCCSASQSDGLPVFADLDLKPNPKCNSLSAQNLVSELCIGRTSCLVHMDPFVNQTWSAVGAPRATDTLPCGYKRAEYNAASGTCKDSFASAGGMNGCTNSAAKSIFVVASCVLPNWTFKSFTLPKSQVALIIGYFDFVACVCFWIAIIWLRRKEDIEIEHHDMSNITPGDYTILLRPVPPHDSITELEPMLKRHFEELLTQVPSTVSDATRASGGGGLAAKVTTIRIADISFATNNATQIIMLKQRGRLMQKIELNLKNRAMLSHDATMGANASRVERKTAKLAAQCAKMEEKIAAIDIKLDDVVRNAGATTRAVAAYITFEEEEGYARCIREYPSSFLYWLCQRHVKRIEGHRLSLERAPEPTDILWENLEVSPTSQALRSALTAIGSLALILASLLFTFYIAQQKRIQSALFPEVDCSNIQNIMNKTLVVRDEYFDLFNLTIGKTGRLQCYCINLLVEVGPQVLWSEIFTWLQVYTTVSSLTYGGSIIILVINILLRTVLKVLVRFERHHSVTTELASRMMKLFVVSVVNTAFIVLLTNARIAEFNTFALLRGGSFDDFGIAWYSSVGTAILLTMCINVIVPHIGFFVSILINAICRCRDRSCTCDRSISAQPTQKELVEIYSGGEFLIAERYAQVMNTLFVTMIYGAGIPALYVTALISFGITFWVDKFMFIRFMRTPPTYADDFSKRVGALLPWAAVVHGGFAVWMLTNSEVFQAAAFTIGLGLDSNLNAATQVSGAGSSVKRISAIHVLPLAVLTLVGIIGLVLKNVLLRLLGNVLRSIMPCFFTNDEELENNPPYWDALSKRVLLAGIRDSTLKPALREHYLAALKRYPQRAAAAAAADGSVGMENPMHDSVSLSRKPSRTLGEDGDDNIGDFDDPDASTKTVQWKELSGVHSYDINDNREYRNIFGLDAEWTGVVKKRRLTMSVEDSPAEDSPAMHSDAS